MYSVATYGIRKWPILSYQTFVTFPSLFYLRTLCYFINFCRLIERLSFSHPLFLFTFNVIYAPYKCTCCKHHTHNSYSRLSVRTLSAPIHFPNSTGVFDQRAILMWGDQGMAGCFLLEQLEPSTALFTTLWMVVSVVKQWNVYPLEIVLSEFTCVAFIRSSYERAKPLAT